MTRWRDYFSLFGFFQQFNFAKNVKNCQRRFKIGQTPNVLSKVCVRFLKVCPSCENFAKFGHPVVTHHWRLKQLLLLKLTPNWKTYLFACSKSKLIRSYLFITPFHIFCITWPDKNRQMSINLPKNGFTRKMNDFDTLTVIA